METFELKNKIFNANFKLLCFIFIVLASLFVFLVLPRSYQLYLEIPSSPQARAPFQVVVTLFAILCTLSFLTLKSSLGKKIRVQDSLVYFMKKTNWGFGSWKIEKVIDFSKVEIVKSREKKVFVGKFFIMHYWLIFEMVGGRSEEILINGWDFEELEKLFHYVRGRFPEVKFNNFILKDSWEKLFGFDELLNKRR